MTRLEQLRLDARLTVKQLAAASGVSNQTILNLESGKGGQVGSLAKLADVLSANPSELLMDALPPRYPEPGEQVASG